MTISTHLEHPLGIGQPPTKLMKNLPLSPDTPAPFLGFGIPTPVECQGDSPTPETQDAWNAYDRRACGLHFVSEKMRGLERQRNALQGSCEGLMKMNARLQIELSKAIEAVAEAHRAGMDRKEQA